MFILLMSPALFDGRESFQNKNMKFQYSRHHLKGREKVLERFFEILPGAISWSIILGMTGLSFFFPLLAAGIMVAFILYWVLRLLYMNIFLLVSYVRLSLEKNTNWMNLITAVDGLHTKGCPPLRPYQGSSFKKKCASNIHDQQLKDLRRSGDLPPFSSNIYHLVILPVIHETKDIIEPSIRSLAGGSYSSQRVLLVIALEECAKNAVKADVYAMQKKHQHLFMDFVVAEHPTAIPGESRVKGANASFAARRAVEYFDERKIPYENVIVSCFDADTVAHPEYFACLTYHFMITTLRLHSSYQPIPVYHNNFWDVPSFARIVDIGASFFQLVESTNPEKLVTFSSHSMSFKALVDVGFWPVDMISDDSAIFWKAFIHYDGHYKAVPIYTTVSMDIASGRGNRETFINIYKQKRRWAWGVENLPIVMRAFLKANKISLYKRLMLGLRMFDSFISWATWSFLLTFITWLPNLFAGKEFEVTTMYYMAPRIKNIIFTLSLAGLLFCMIISLLLLPRGRKAQRFPRIFLHILEWMVIPSVVLLLSALPALDAQTRLMFGKYMDFQVTYKHRSKRNDH